MCARSRHRAAYFGVVPFLFGQNESGVIMLQAVRYFRSNINAVLPSRSAAYTDTGVYSGENK